MAHCFSKVSDEKKSARKGQKKRRFWKKLFCCVTAPVEYKKLNNDFIEENPSPNKENNTKEVKYDFVPPTFPTKIQYTEYPPKTLQMGLHQVQVHKVPSNIEDESTQEENENKTVVDQADEMPEIIDLHNSDSVEEEEKSQINDQTGTTEKNEDGAEQEERADEEEEKEELFKNKNLGEIENIEVSREQNDDAEANEKEEENADADADKIEIPITNEDDNNTAEAAVQEELEEVVVVVKHSKSANQRTRQRRREGK